MDKKIKIIAVILLFVLMTIPFMSCKKDAPIDEPKKTANGIKVEEEIVMIKGTSFTLEYTFTPADAQKPDVEFSANNDVVTISNNGVVTANKVGESEVKVKQRNGDKFAICKVIVADLIVEGEKGTVSSASYGSAAILACGYKSGDDEGNNTTGNTSDNEENNTLEGTDNPTGDDTNTSEGGANEGANTSENTNANQVQDEQTNQNETPTAPTGKNDYRGKLGETLFRTVQEAVNHAEEENCIVVKSGEYGEKVKINKSLTLKGLKNAKVKGVEIGENTTVTIEGFAINEDNYPLGTESRVKIKSGATATVKNCIISTTSTAELSGGYAIFVDKQAENVSIYDNTISNFRYGIYVCSTDGEVHITNNNLSNMECGIGIDLRQENSTENYPTKGEIKSNKYNEVVSNTQFLHYGDQYNGEFDFDDNQVENAATDEGSLGGSGLTE